MDYDFKVASKSVGNSKITSIIACVGLHWLQGLKFTGSRNNKWTEWMRFNIDSFETTLICV